MEPMSTLRDQFAIAALNAYIGCDASGVSYWKADDGMEETAVNAYAWSDSMLKARNRK
jgi:hypothetical protein